MLIRAKAPLRISFAGGGTDVPPYCDEKGGCVLSATINKYAYGTLMPSGTKETTVNSLDYDMIVKYNVSTDLIYNGELDLVKSIVRHFNLGGEGVKLFLHSDAPPGSGLGTSSTMTVTLIGLFKHWQKRPLTDYEIADLAYFIERKELNIPGGKQDQYAATFGGVNFIEFTRDHTIVNPLRVEREIVHELEYRSLLVYTGRTRLSGEIIKDQVKGYEDKKEDVVAALDITKRIALEMKNCILQGKLDRVAELLHEGWMAKRNFSKYITTPEIDKLYALARENGAIGGKLLGAGGGGYLLLFCEFDKKHIVAKKLMEHGAQPIDFNFEWKGLQTWSVY